MQDQMIISTIDSKTMIRTKMRRAFFDTYQSYSLLPFFLTTCCFDLLIGCFIVEAYSEIIEFIDLSIRANESVFLLFSDPATTEF